MFDPTSQRFPTPGGLILANRRRCLRLTCGFSVSGADLGAPGTRTWHRVSVNLILLHDTPTPRCGGNRAHSPYPQGERVRSHILFHWCTKCGRGCEFCDVILTLRGVFTRLRPVRLRPFGPQVRSELEFDSSKWPATETFLQVLICGSRSINRAMAPFWISFTSLGSRGNYGHRRS